jgi:group I intron endonuclease
MIFIDKDKMEDKKHVIYCIINIKNGKKYIGSAVDYNRRVRRHLNFLRKNYHHSNKLQKSFNRYGEENFKFKVLEEVVKISDLIEREQFWLDKEKPEYNMTLIAGLNSHLGLKRSEETKKKISEALKGRKLSDEHINGMRAGLTGKTHSEETKLKRIESMRKSELVKKAYKSEERKEKTKKTRIANGGYIVTDEMKKKISETLKSKNLQSAISKKIGKYDMDGNLLEIYPSVSKAEIENGYKLKTLSYHIVSKGKETYGGFKWKLIVK